MKPTRLSPVAAIMAIAMVVSGVCAEAAPARPSAKPALASGDAVSDALLQKLGIARGAVDQKSGIHEFKLKSNGLSILTVERHAAPVVTVMLLYKVGSRNEAVGYTGSTHFLEHLMFKGSKNFDPQKGTGIDDLLKPTGGYNNATTSFDRTNYFEVVPSKYLDLCLSFDADRMRNLLIRQADRESEMTVVRNELERLENDAQSLLSTQTFATAYVEHPYHHPTIGWRSDVEGVPIERLRQFYREFYWPNNATLLITGDFVTAAALTSVAKFFGAIPASPRPIPSVYTQEPPQQGERRFTVKRGADQPKVMVAYHVPKAVSEDTYPLDVLDALLGDNDRPASRYYKALIEKGLASEVSAFNYSLRDPGVFLLAATAAPGVKPEDLEPAMLAELDKLKTEKVSSDELERAKASIVKGMTIMASDPHNMCEQLAESIAVADWKFWTTYRQRIKAVTADDVMRMAGKYMSGDNRTVGYYLPKNQDASPAQGKKSESPPGVSAPRAKDLPGAEAGLPATTPPRSSGGKYTFASQVVKRTLGNGLTLLLMPIPGIGAVCLAGQIASGRYFTARDKTLVPDLLADLLTKGSEGVGKNQLAEELDLMGSGISVRSGNFWTEVSSQVVTEDFPRLVPLVAEVLEHPLLEAEELARAKSIRESLIKQSQVNTSDLAQNAFLNNVYQPGSPYYQRPFPEQLEELKTITAHDLRQFHKRQVIPNNMVLAVVGDIDIAQAGRLIEKAFSGWGKGTATPIERQSAKELDKARRVVIEVADKENADVTIGHALDLSIKDKDFFPELIGNAALGHDPFASRLAPVRTKHGLTYDISASNRSVGYGGGPWAIDFSVNPKSTDKAIAVVNELVKRYLKEGISARELDEEAKRQGGEYVVALRTPGRIAQLLSNYAMLGLGPEFADNYPARLAAVKQADVNRAIRKYLSLDRALTVMAGSFKQKSGGQESGTDKSGK